MVGRACGSSTLNSSCQRVAHALTGHRISKAWAEEQHVYFALESEREIARFTREGNRAFVEFAIGDGSHLDRGLHPRHDAGVRRGDLDRRLVGLDLHERIVLADRVAFLHGDPDDLTFVHAFAEIGELEFPHAHASVSWTVRVMSSASGR